MSGDSVVSILRPSTCLLPPMQGLAVILFPLLLMLFALAMERVEGRLRRLSVQEHEVEDFLDQASHDDVARLASDGFPHAFARFHRKRKGRQSEAPESASLGEIRTQRAITAADSGRIFGSYVASITRRELTGRRLRCRTCCIEHRLHWTQCLTHEG
eukprot:gene23095-27690_t